MKPSDTHYSTDFKSNTMPTIGIELELQLVDLQYFNLAMEANDFLRRLSRIIPPDKVKPEITQSMLEINSSAHDTYDELFKDIRHVRNQLVREAGKTHIGICGGGTHPFQKWQNQRIYQTKRFENVSEQYGYLAKQFTVFGQHIHVGCTNGDDALYLCHALAHYIPHFIALSASSPFYQDTDTSFECSRLTVISAFPLSGTPPWILSWAEFEEYFFRMSNLGLVTSMKDFYWDIRPKPDTGTIELRICDTPLTIEKACQLAAYLQMLCHWLLEVRPKLSRDIYLTYLVNRFRAARYGLEAIIVDPINGTQKTLIEDILQTCTHLEPHAEHLNSMEVLMHLREQVMHRQTDAAWLRSRHQELQCLNDVVRKQTELWKS